MASRERKIRIAHIHVWDQKNKGDYAIVLAVQELLRKNFPGCLIEDYPVEILKIYDAKSITDLNGADLIIIGGGGIFYSYFLPFNPELIRALNQPIVLFGLGYIKEVDAPLWSQDKTDSVVALAKQAAAIGVRDFNTARFLKANGVAEDRIEIVGDPAALLAEQELIPEESASRLIILGPN